MKTTLSGFTVRTVIIGLVCVFFLSIATPYCDFVLQTTWLGGYFLPIGGIFIFFILTLGVNILLKKLKLGLNSSELLLIYCMMLFGSGIPSFGLIAHLIPLISAIFYYATPENRWVEVFHQYIPKWMTPQDKDAIKYLYEGLPKGMPIPWKFWIEPFFSWMIVVIGMYLAMFSLVVILRKQWVENEKLVFPLVHLPVGMVEEPEGGNTSLLSSFFRNKIMWFFFLVPVVIYSMKGLHFYFPMIPDIRTITRLTIVEKPWNGIYHPLICIFFSVIGFMYLLPTQLTFSLWFFYLLFQAQQVAGVALGFPMPMMHGMVCRAFTAYQMAGATIVFAFYAFWKMKKPLIDIFRKAFKNDPNVDDSNEPSTYRFALIGLILGVFLISFWGKMTGASFWFTFLIVIFSLLIFIAATRLVAEGGMFFLQPQFRPLDIILPFIGSSVIAPATITTIGLFETLFMRDIRGGLMPMLMDGFKISDSMKIKRRQLTFAMVLSIVLAVVVSYIFVLVFMYKFGGINLRPWFCRGLPAQVTAGRIVMLIQTPQPPNITNIISMLVGGGITVFLMWMSRTFLWWPFHPIGYVMGVSWPMLQFWFPIFIAWLIKVLVLRLGGIKIYRKLIPGFLGLVLSEFVVIVIWSLVDFFAGVMGHQVMSL